MRHFWRKVCSHWLWSLLSICLAGLLVIAAILLTLLLQLPNTETLNRVQYSEPLRIYSSDGHLLAQYGSERRIPITFKEVPPKLVDAVLATEDQRFYEHPGVDPIGILRAAYAVISSGKKVQGASTITMQVARNFFLTRKKTYSRKIEEMLLALKIDHEFEKQKILELYLNKIYFGNHAYGVAAAAEVYYGKKLHQLTLPQMAMIAGLPQAPSRANPLRRPKDATIRRNHVLERMQNAGFISKQEMQQAQQAPITASYHYKEVPVTAPYAAEAIRQLVVKEFGKQKAYHQGLIVNSTINLHLQNVAHDTLRKGLIQYSERHGWIGPLAHMTATDHSTWQSKLKSFSIDSPLQAAVVTKVDSQQIHVLDVDAKSIIINWDGLQWAKKRLDDKNHTGRAPKQASDLVSVGDVIVIRQDSNHAWRMSQQPEVQGALITMNPYNGAIEAIQGGFDYYRSKFNRALQASRQPGSCFKPFIYSAALNRGLTLASIINDAPIVVADSGEDALWRPDNDNFRFDGPTRLRVGLSESRNLVSIRLLQLIGIPYALDYVQRFGFNPNDLPRSLSLALGSGNMTPETLADGFSVFANGGYRVQPFLVNNITLTNGEIIQQNGQQHACTNCINSQTLTEISKQDIAPEVITAQNAYLMVQAMHDVIEHGTGRAALVLNRKDLAGKTGTTNKQVDAWFAGFNDKIVSVVWVGYDDQQRSLREYGAKAALPIWIDFMHQALKGMPNSTLEQPPGIISVPINATTGAASTAGAPGSIFELFRKEYAPNSTANNDTKSNGNSNSSPTSTGSLEGLF